jgi:hypothetical protein
VVLRTFVPTLLALFAGAVCGFGLSLLFLSTPLQRVLGPRYSEFDFFGVIGVVVFATPIAGLATLVATCRSRERMKATFGTRNLLGLVALPFAVLLGLTLRVSGEFSWVVLIHLSICLGLFAGVGSSLWLAADADAK